MANSYPRYIPTNATGVSILAQFVNSIGWIPREITKEDMGIDMYMEQVIDGTPTARYIAVQLKTGYGNVAVSKRNGNLTVKNISEADKKYWELSSCPVIVVFCDPDTLALYWTLYRHDVCRKSIVINPENILNKDSIFELNSIIEAYQKPFSLTEIDDSDVRNDPNYWTDLLDSCKEVIANNTNIFNQFHNKYEAINTNSQQFIDKHSAVSQKAASSFIRSQSHRIATSMDVCRTQFKSQIPIIQDTFIEAFSLFRYFSDNFFDCIPAEIKKIIQVGLSELQKQIQTSVDFFSEAEKEFRQSNSKDYRLRKSEYAFSLILSDYVISLQRMLQSISSILDIYK